MSEWTENFENDIKVQIEGVKRLEAGYINVRLLNNTAKKLDQFSAHCSTCKQYKSDYDILLPELVERIKEPKYRDEYEQKLVQVVDHMEKAHGLRPKSYYTSMFTFVGLVSGSILLVTLSYFIQKEAILTALLYGAFGGLIVGRILGLIKDKKLVSENKYI